MFPREECLLCDNLPIKISLIFNLILPSAHSEKVIPLSHPEHGSQARRWTSRLPFGGESRAEEAFFILKPYAKHAKVKLATGRHGCHLMGKITERAIKL